MGIMINKWESRGNKRKDLGNWWHQTVTPHWSQVQESPSGSQPDGSQPFLLNGDKDIDKIALVIQALFFLLAHSFPS